MTFTDRLQIKYDAGFIVLFKPPFVKGVDRI